MHRRQFITAAAGALLLPSGFTHAAQDLPTPAATPPQHHGRPRPIVLGDGIELIDYRIYPSEDVPRIIGEISNTRDDMVDSPVASITFPDLGKEGHAYAPPVLPVMRPGESNMIFGVLPKEIDSDEKLLSGDFSLCSSASITPADKNTINEALVVDDLQEDRDQFSQRFVGKLRNTGSEPIDWAAIRGLVRDGEHRLAGCTPSYVYHRLIPNQPQAFEIWSTSTVLNPANPYRLLRANADYSGKLCPGEFGTVVASGC